MVRELFRWVRAFGVLLTGLILVAILLSGNAIGQDVETVSAAAVSEVEAAPVLADVATLAADAKFNADLVWVMASAALVMLMQAGFALLEGGMTRSKNSVNVLMKNYTDMAFGSIAFFVVGYGLMFGDNPTGFIGLSHFFPNSLSGGDYGFLIFQLMFAATAATIVSGACAERTKYWGYIIFSLIITGLIYPIFGSWAWGSHYDGSGWLSALGFIDFAGSTVVHSVGGWAALAAIIVIGPRTGRFGRDGSVRSIPGHSLMMVALGGFILWFGWFGFNGGSIINVEANLGLIMLNTQLAACAGVVGAIAWLRITGRGVLLTASINGGLGGLVGITAGCASMDPVFALLTGLAAGVISVLASDLLLRLKLDDVVGAVAVHGVCGAWGTLAAGLFKQGQLFDPRIVGVQLAGIAACFVWTFGVSYLLFRLIAMTVGLRASTMHEQRGLDISEHEEISYPEFEEGLIAREQA